MSLDEVTSHGKKYSKTFGNKYGVWQTDFNAMGEKTVLKRLLSKYAPLSIEMQKAIISDQSVINNAETLDVSYIDNEVTKEDNQRDRIIQLIGASKSVEQLEKLAEHINDNDNELLDIYLSKMYELKGGNK